MLSQNELAVAKARLDQAKAERWLNFIYSTDIKAFQELLTEYLKKLGSLIDEGESF
jgi:hypothetical protein